ncbi:MAG: sensor histidine kinase [Chloroflexia bacterium]|nr:sensor histidine kinase [Chloroflexia bacterium]
MTTRPPRSAAETDAWERWLPRWHLAFAGILAVATASALTDPGQSWSHRAGSLGLTAALAGWYWAMVVARPDRIRDTGRMLLYLAVATALFVALTTLHPAFMLLIFCLYWQVYAFLCLLPATSAAAALTVIVVWRSAALAGRPVEVGAQSVLIGAIALAVSGMFAWYIDVIIRQSEGRRRLIEELRATRGELAVAERQAGVLRERQRLAREIHDTLAQGFIGIVTHLEAAEPALPPDAETARWHLDQARRSAREGLAEARRLVRALRPEILEQGSLAEAVIRLTAGWGALSGVAATATVTGIPRPLHAEVEITLLRATQEALANVRRHAAAACVSVTLSYMEDQIALDIHDDGVGFDPATVGAGEGYGLVAMGDRATELGGTLTVESEPEGGTTVAVTLPAVPTLAAASATGEGAGNGLAMPVATGIGDG